MVPIFHTYVKTEARLMGGLMGARRMHSRWESVWGFIKKVKIELPYHSAVLILGICPKYSKYYYRDTCTPMFIAALATIAKIWNQCRSPSKGECIKIMVHIHSEPDIKQLK